MATITTAGSGNWDAGATWTGGSVPGDGDTASIESGHTCTLTENEQVGAVVINGGTIAGGGFKITCVKTSGRLFDHSGTITGNLDVELQGTHNTTEDFMGTGNIRNLTLNGSGLNVDIGRATTIDGNLTITQGTLHTNASSNHALTVTGATTIGPNSGAADQATLTCNASTISLGASETSSFALRVAQGGTFTGGTGAHTIGSLEVVNNAAAKCTLTSGVTTISSERTSANRAIDIAGTSATFDDGNGTVTFTFAGTTRISLSGKSLYNVIVNDSSASVEYIADTTIDNDLTVTAGKFRYNNFHDLTVTGDVSVTGILGHPTTTTTSNCTFGSLTINSGGEYKAPSGTTTITDESSGGYALENQGTFTHNKGKVLIDFDTPNKNDNTDVKCNEFYDFEIKMNSASYSVIFRDLSGDTVTFFGDLTITQGKFDDNVNADDYVIHGTTIVESNGFFGTATNWHTGDITHHGLVVLNGGTYYRSDAGGTVKMGGIRNIGGSIL